MRPLVLLFLVLGLPGLLQGQAERGAVEGRVIDEANGEPVPAARVEILDGTGRILASAATDADGVFRLDGLADGAVHLRASRIGYASIDRSERVVVGETLVLTLRLRPEVLTLAPFEVGGRLRAPPPGLHRFADRASRGIGGTHLTREEIQARAPGRISDLLVGIPGVRISEDRTFGRTARRVSLAWALPGQAGEGCPLQVFLNGAPARDSGVRWSGARTGGAEGVPIDHLAHPSELEGIEVYTDLASVPAEFLTPDAGCGVLALWTLPTL